MSKNYAHSRSMRRFMTKFGQSWGEWEERPAEVKVLVQQKATEHVKRAWNNDRYHVMEMVVGDIQVLMVGRHDCKPDMPWTDLQRIKNELIGEEREAVEVFPKVSELIDQANARHIWIIPENERLNYRLQNLGWNG